MASLESYSGISLKRLFMSTKTNYTPSERHFLDKSYIKAFHGVFPPDHLRLQCFCPTTPIISSELVKHYDPEIVYKRNKIYFNISMKNLVSYLDKLDNIRDRIDIVIQTEKYDLLLHMNIEATHYDDKVLPIFRALSASERIKFCFNLEEFSYPKDIIQDDFDDVYICENKKITINTLLNIYTHPWHNNNQFTWAKFYENLECPSVKIIPGLYMLAPFLMIGTSLYLSTFLSTCTAVIGAAGPTVITQPTR